MSDSAKIKIAVFQISRAGVTSRLVGLQVPTMGDAVFLESALRERLGADCHVEFLGRFDELLMAPTMAEFLDLALEPKGRDDQTILRRSIASWFSPN
jgi:hypothetical protein